MGVRRDATQEAKIAGPRDPGRKKKKVQSKIHEDVSHLAELKAQTEAALKQIKEERRDIATPYKELKKGHVHMHTENAASGSTTQTEQKVQTPTIGRIAKASLRGQIRPQQHVDKTRRGFVRLGA